MKNKITEMVFILDKSGSMAGAEEDTIGGFNSMINNQKEVEGKAYVSTVLFSNHSTVLHDRVDLQKVEPLTKKDYMVGGSTALLDALGDAIKHISNVHKYAREEDVPGLTIFVVTTDGYENASTKYTKSDIKRMIRQKEEDCGWEFLYLGANVDAVEEGTSIGFRQDRVSNYDARYHSTETFEEMGNVLAHCIRFSEIDEGWNDKIEEMAKEKKKK